MLTGIPAGTHTLAHPPGDSVTATASPARLPAVARRPRQGIVDADANSSAGWSGTFTSLKTNVR
jgi:hypothetical protein